MGSTFEEFEKMEKIEAEIPVFYPIIGMSKKEVDKKISFLFSNGH